MTATAPVVLAREVSLNGVKLPVTNGIRPFVIDQVVPQLQIGGSDEVKEEKASKWFFSNTVGGHGRYRFHPNAQQQPDKFFDSSIRTDMSELTLLPLATQAVDLGATVAGICEWSGAVYFAGGTHFRRTTDGSTYQGYCTTHNAWETDGSIHNEKTLPDSFVSFGVYNGKLLFWCGTNGTTYDGATTFANIGVTGSYSVVYDGKCVVVDSTGQLKYTTDLSTFTNLAKVYDAAPTALCVWMDGQGDPAIWVGTAAGAWVVDFYLERAYPSQVVFNDYWADNCRGMRPWNGDLVIPKGGNVRRFDFGSRVAQEAEMGPGMTEDGMAQSRQGRAVAVEASMEHMLLVAYDGGTGGTSSVLMWRDAGWHTLVLGSASGSSIRALCFSTLNASAATAPRLWYGEGTKVWWIPWWDTTANPIQTPAAMTYQASGTLITPWFGSPELRSIAMDFRLQVGQITSTERVDVYAAYDNDDSSGAWNLIGTVANNGTVVVRFPFAGGQPFRTIRIKLVLRRGSTTTLTPRVYSAVLRWTPQPRSLWGYSFEVAVDASYGGKTPAALESAIQTAVDAGVVVFSYRPDDDRYVRVEKAQALTIGGRDNRGRWQMTATEVVPASDVTSGFQWDGATKWTTDGKVWS